MRKYFTMENEIMRLEAKKKKEKAFEKSSPTLTK